MAQPAMHCKGKKPKIWNKYSQKRNIGASVPISTFMCLWANYIFPLWACLFCWRKYVDRSWEYINRSQTHECKIGAEAAQFPEKEYINGIAVAVCVISVMTVGSIRVTKYIRSRSRGCNCKDHAAKQPLCQRRQCAVSQGRRTQKKIENPCYQIRYCTKVISTGAILVSFCLQQHALHSQSMR